MWGHCHHRATGGLGPEESLLSRMGLEVEPLTGGCCGLAGSWGFEKGKYDLSMQCGEQALLPAVRDADEDTVIVADGFSCKTQIEQSGSGRRALHVAEVMALARAGRPAGLHRRPEDDVPASRPAPPRGRRVARVAVPGAALAVAGTGVVMATRQVLRSTHATR